MINYNYETKNEPLDNDYFDFKSSYIEYVNAEDSFNTEVFEYVQMMKKEGICTIVNMNKYLTRNNLWDRFLTIASKNTYSNGFSAIRVSKSAYSAITNLYKTQDEIKSSLIQQNKIDKTQIQRKNYRV
jgi:hypothetical protein